MDIVQETNFELTIEELGRWKWTKNIMGGLFLLFIPIWIVPFTMKSILQEIGFQPQSVAFWGLIIWFVSVFGFLFFKLKCPRCNNGLFVLHLRKEWGNQSTNCDQCGVKLYGENLYE